MEILIPVKSGDMPPTESRRWVRRAARLVVCLVLSLACGAANAEENRRVLKLTYLNGLPMSSLLPQLRQAPNHMVVLFGAINQDAMGQRFISTTQSLPAGVGATNAPGFVLNDV